MQAFLVPLKGIAGPQAQFLQATIDACDQLRNYEVLTTPVVECLIDFKWSAYAKKRFLRDALKYFLLLVAFSVQAVMCPAAFAKGAPSGEFYLGFLPLPVIVVLWAGFARHEALTVQDKSAKGLWRHASEDIWNVLDVFTLLGIPAVLATQLVEVVVMISSGENADADVASGFSGSSFLAALVLPAAWFGGLYYMLGFKESGTLIRMVLVICWSIGPFLFVLGATLTGFALAFFALNQAGPGEIELPDVGPYSVSDEASGYSNAGEALLTGFALMLGDFDLQEFAASLSPTLMRILFVVFMLLVNIVLLNLLIAIMGDVFDRVQDSAKAQYLYSLAKIILEYDTLIPQTVRTANPLKFPNYLQVLVPQKSDGAGSTGDEWAGRIRALQRRMESMSKQIKDDVKTEVNEVKTEVNEVKTEVKEVKTEIKSEVGAVQQRIQALESGMVDLGSKLDTVLQLLTDRQNASA